MDDVANYANDVLVMESGKLIKHARPAEVFKDRSWLKEHYIEEPKASLFASKLTNFTFSNTPLTIKELVKGIENNLKE